MFAKKCCCLAHGKRSDQLALYPYGNVNLRNNRAKDLVHSKDVLNDLSEVIY